MAINEPVECAEEVTPLFKLGRMYATPGALRALEEAGVGLMDLIERHGQKDWGELSEGDRMENERALGAGDRILSSYPIGASTRIWIITEADRSATTLLLPEEY